MLMVILLQRSSHENVVYIEDLVPLLRYRGSFWRERPMLWRVSQVWRSEMVEG